MKGRFYEYLFDYEGDRQNECNQSHPLKNIALAGHTKAKTELNYSNENRDTLKAALHDTFKVGHFAIGTNSQMRNKIS